ncbi:MAG: DUF3368 domain-containing protein [Chloroflexi bacterium]|nr:DUF3368 domain-containing protein [Chloroflexota bacterium]
MAEIWISNASPLIVLARIGREDLLLALPDQIAIPRAVASEIQAGSKEDRARQLVDMDKVSIVDTPDPPADVLAWGLGAGETAVLSFALAMYGWTAILDDATARKCARSLNISVKGTVAVIIMAKQKGLISSAAEIIQMLRTTGFYIDSRTIREALARTVGEEWPL